MQVNHSQAISAILTKLAKQKQLKHAKQMCLWHTCLTRMNQLSDLIKTLGDKYGTPDIVYGTTSTSATTLFFDEPEAEVLQKLEAIPFSGTTAPKTIVKMIYSRILKTRHQIDYMERGVKQHLAAKAVQQAQNPNVNCSSEWAENWVRPTITFESITDANAYSDNYDLQRLAEDLAAVISRNSVTPELLEQAWKLYQTYDVMNS